MTTTDPQPDVVDLVTRAREIEQDATARAAAQAEAEAKHAAAAEEADRLAAEAERAARVKGKNRPLVDTMRDVGDAIDAARQAAVDAVLTGNDPASAWIAYRLEAARQLGIWDAFAGHYTAVSGRQAPPGPGHRVPPLPGPAGNPRGEDFNRFMTDVLRKAEPAEHRAAHRATGSVLRGDTTNAPDAA